MIQNLVNRASSATVQAAYYFGGNVNDVEGLVAPTLVDRDPDTGVLTIGDQEVQLYDWVIKEPGGLVVIADGSLDADYDRNTNDG